MATYFQCSPIRIYSAANSNRKTKAITEFVRDVLSRQFINIKNKNKVIEILKCEAQKLDKKFKFKSKLMISATKTNEWDCKKDFYIMGSVMNEDGSGKELFNILCFLVEIDTDLIYKE